MINIKRSLAIVDNLKDPPASDEGFPWVVVLSKELDGEEASSFLLAPEVDFLRIVIEDGGEVVISDEQLRFFYLEFDLVCLKFGEVVGQDHEEFSCIGGVGYLHCNCVTFERCEDVASIFNFCHFLAILIS